MTASHPTETPGGGARGEAIRLIQPTWTSSCPISPCPDKPLLCVFPTEFQAPEGEEHPSARPSQHAPLPPGKPENFAWNLALPPTAPALTASLITRLICPRLSGNPDNPFPAAPPSHLTATLRKAQTPPKPWASRSPGANATRCCPQAVAPKRSPVPPSSNHLPSQAARCKLAAP